MAFGLQHRQDHPCAQKEKIRLKKNRYHLCNRRALAKVIGQQIQANINKALPQNLFGGIPGRSTTDAINSIKERVIQKLSSRKEVVAIVACDASKAFDSVPHEAILAAIKQTGAKKSVIQLIESYLNNQKQFLEYSGIRSESWSNKGFGFFQGDVWSSILYNIATAGHTLPSDLQNSAKFIDDEIVVAAATQTESIKP